MPSSHLACDGSTEPVSPFPCGIREASLRRQEAAVRFSYGFTGSAASTIWFTKKFYKCLRTVVRRHVVGGIAQFPHCGTVRRAILARAPVRFLCRGCGDWTAIARHCTISVQSPHSFCTDLPRVAPEAPYNKLHDARKQCEHICRSPYIATYDAQNKIARKIVDKFIPRRPGQM